MDKADEQFYKIQAILQQNCKPPVVMLYFRYCLFTCKKTQIYYVVDVRAIEGMYCFKFGVIFTTFHSLNNFN